MVERKRGRILYADNDSAFLLTRKDFLESEGYEVLTAGNPVEAREVLQNRWVHLALIDLRLTDESRTDISGLTLVKETDPDIPKIIVTAYVSQQATHESLRMQQDGTHPAVDFIGKQDGWEVMVKAVNNSFSHHVRVDMNLRVHWGAPDPFSLVHRVEPGVPDAYVLDRALEIEDLFRRLFYGKKELLIEHILWHGGGQVALAVYAYDEGQFPEGLVVVCGRKAEMADTLSRYKESAPRALGDYGTILSDWKNTTHYAAHLYALAYADLDGVQSLSEHYRGCSERAFSRTVESLCRRTLAVWGRSKGLVTAKWRTPAEFYRERFGLSAGAFDEEQFESRVQSLVELLRGLDWDLRLEGKDLRLKLGDRSFTYHDPVRVLYRLRGPSGPLKSVNTPGQFSGENVLADRNGHAWVTDFSAAGLAPAEWNYVCLESIVRFDWTRVTDLHLILQMEERLNTGQPVKFDVAVTEATVRRPLKAIQAIRRQAHEAPGKDWTSYKVGILFHAARLLAEAKLEPPPLLAALARLGHALLTIAMLGQQLMETGLRIDKNEKAVWKNGTRLSLLPQSWALLLFLYEQPNHTSTQEEILSKVLEAGQTEDPKSKSDRLSMAVRRLRTGLGDTRKRYIRTEHGSYRLVLRPED